MHRTMRQVELKSGETADIWKITAPDHSWAEKLLDFLSHKGEPWLWPMRQALAKGLGGLTMNFYECVLGEHIVGNITVVESLERPIGLLQHVFTLPEHRRKGIASTLMKAVLHDFTLRGGRAMYLGTGYHSPAFWIYYEHGFRPICQTGHMRWFAYDGFLDDYFAPDDVSVRDTRWSDWPLLEAVYATVEGWTVRSTQLGLYGQSSYEGPFLHLMEAIRKRRVKQSLVMVKNNGAVVGHAAVWAQRECPGEPWLLEFFVHPNFYDRAPQMLSRVFIPPHRKLQAIADSDAWEKHRLLKEMGMWREATLRHHIAREGRWLDLHFYCSRWVPE
jgi:GNAT superfamily N-acetyltransferase